MRTILILLFVVLVSAPFYSAQAQLTPKKDEPEVEKVEKKETSTSENEKESSTTSALKKKTEVFHDASAKDEDEEGEEPVKKQLFKDSPNSVNGKDWIPRSYIEIYFGWESLANPNSEVMKGSGWFGSFTIRQPQALDNLKTSVGLKIQTARYTMDSRADMFDTGEAFHSETVENSIELSIAKITKRTNYNSVVWTLGVQEATDKGSKGLYSRKQIDMSFITSLYLDIGKNRNKYFAGTELSMYYRYPLNTEIESYYNGVAVANEVWNKKMLNFFLNQTLLQFNLSEMVDKVTCNAGIGFGYSHFSQGPEDWYYGGLYADMFYKKCKMVRLSVGQDFKPSGGKMTRIKLETDLFQFGRMVASGL